MFKRLNVIKLIVIMQLLFFVLNQGVGQDTIQYAKYEFSMLNDSWGGGIAKMSDDLRTFGFDFRYTSKGLISVYTKYSSFTNRYHRDSLQRKRFDELVFKTRLPVLNLPSSNGSMGLILGVYANGNFGGEIIQNLEHDRFNISKVELPYYKGISFHHVVGMYFSNDILNQRITENRSLMVKMDFTAEYSYQYLFLTQISFPFIYKYEEDKYLLFKVGYNYVNNLSDNELRKDILEAESGLNFAIRIAFKNTYFYYEVFKDKPFSSGGFGMRFTPGHKNKELVTSKDKLEISIVSKGYGYNLKYLKEIATLYNRKVSFIIILDFHSLLKLYLPSYPDVLGHGNQLTIGAELDLFEPLDLYGIVNPYMNLSFGVRIVSIYSGLVEIDRLDYFHFAMNNDVGVKIRLPLKIFTKKINLNFLAYRRLMLLSPIEDGELVRPNASPHKTLQHRYGAGVIFDF